jgi:hypothetical protein
MTFGRFALSLLLVLPLMSAMSFGQKTKPSPTPERRVILGSGDAPTPVRSRTNLQDEKFTADLEPRSKRFMMNINWLRGVYTNPLGNAAGHQYVWDIFTEGFLMLQFFDLPGTIPTEAEARKQFAIDKVKGYLTKTNWKLTKESSVRVSNLVDGEQFEGIIDEHKVIVRTFAYEDELYVMTAVLVPENAGPSVKKFFDSFQFVTRLN